MKENAIELHKEVQKKIVVFSVLSMPGAMLLGLGLLGTFGEDAGSVHPMLNDTSVVNLMLAVGVIAASWCCFKLMPLEREKARLKNSYEGFCMKEFV
jgi:hypothetical protein